MSERQRPPMCCVLCVCDYCVWADWALSLSVFRVSLCVSSARRNCGSDLPARPSPAKFTDPCLFNDYTNGVWLHAYAN